MRLIVQKFGGSSVKDAACIRRAAGIIAQAYNEGNEVVAVLSAQGSTTDELIEKAKEIAPSAQRREMDMLLSSGEQVSAALCAMALQEMGVRAVSLTAWQAGIETDDTYGNASIQRIDVRRIRRELSDGKVVLVTGFQGVCANGDITTLGRGGSDTSAVALAAALGAEKCRIYTDVEGVFTADPRIVPTAHKMEKVAAAEMLELSAQGAQVMHERSIELAQRHHVEIEVRSSLEPETEGTVIAEEIASEASVTAVTRNAELLLLRVARLSPPSKQAELLRAFAEEKIRVDGIWQSDETDEGATVRMTLAAEDAPAVLRMVKECGVVRDDADVTWEMCAKVSVVGSGVMRDAAVPARILAALCGAGIGVKQLAASERSIAALVAPEDAERAVRVLHDSLFTA